MSASVSRLFTALKKKKGGEGRGEKKRNIVEINLAKSKLRKVVVC